MKVKGEMIGVQALARFCVAGNSRRCQATALQGGLRPQSIKLQWSGSRLGLPSYWSSWSSVAGNFALGQDWPVFGFLARWDAKSGSPRVAMLVQGAIALALVIFGAFQNAGFKGLVEYSLPVFWGFFMLTGTALFILRFREPQAARPFPVPGYPVVPAIFVATCAALLWSSLVYHGRHALVGLGVLAVGAVIMAFARRKRAAGAE